MCCVVLILLCFDILLSYFEFFEMEKNDLWFVVDGMKVFMLYFFGGFFMDDLCVSFFYGEIEGLLLVMMFVGIYDMICLDVW